MTTRIDRCRSAMAARELEAFLATEIENVRYLTGFTGSAGSCLLTGDKGYFITDGRYLVQSRQEIRDIEIRIVPQGSSATDVVSLLNELKLSVGFEADHVSVAQFQEWQAAATVALQPTSGLVEDLRMIKDDEEIGRIRDAVKIVDTVFEYILNLIKVGVTERELGIEIDFAMRKHGADREAFETIVAAGPNSALPHARPTSRPLAIGDLVTMDFGAYHRGYNSDITRTVAVGKPGEKQREIYTAVLEAQCKALAAIRPGVKGQDVDWVARESIEAAGFGACFPHGLGHSLGRKVHDGKLLGMKVERLLEPGMVATVEPGIYVEGVGGVRIEDDILVTVDGCEILTRSPKDLIVV